MKEKKLNSIKSEMKEIKEFIVSYNDSDNSEDDNTDHLNNDDDTMTLTQIVKDDTNFNNNIYIDEVKKDLVELKKSIEENKNLLKEILLRIK